MSEKRKFEGLLTRVIAAVVLIPLVLAPVYFGGHLFTTLLMVAAFVMATEWVGILKSAHARRDGFFLTMFLLVLLLVGTLRAPIVALQFLILLLFLGGLAAYVFRARVTPILGGLLYIGWPLLAAQHFRFVGEDIVGLLLVGYVLLSVWLVDIFAMFSGKIIGGPKLAPRLSPNKTWAGLLGAVVGAMVAAWVSFIVIIAWDAERVALLDLLRLGAVLALVAQAADLFESAIKRKYAIKDSGALIPGHGGILDRVDGLVGVLIFLHIVAVVRGGAPASAIWLW